MLGIYAPMFTGNEIGGSEGHVRHATNYVWWGSFIAFAAYILGTFGIMVIVPPNQAGSLLAPVVALQMVFGPLIGNAAAIVG